jgi:hypothetical protein
MSSFLSRRKYTIGIIVVGLVYALFVVFLWSIQNYENNRNKKESVTIMDENYYDSIQVVNDAAKDSNSSHIPY